MFSTISNRLLPLLCFTFLLTSSPMAHAAAGPQGIDPPDDTYYYEYSEVLFGTGVDQNGDITGEATEFKLDANGKANITVAVYNDEAFLTQTASVEIYNEENELIDSFEIELQTEWNWFKFQIQIEKAGKYFLDIYNEIDVFINSGSFEVVN